MVHDRLYDRLCVTKNCMISPKVDVPANLTASRLLAELHITTLLTLYRHCCYKLSQAHALDVLRKSPTWQTRTN
ncbi:hypothetical protein KIN20_014201 [Parelaphostrongylus tenuis]|uniref:Uncharacterized protein n=1 Tax=Parelaphostrongylus tenuis TaxID=148309 RepID=A0AAD5QRN5_PARTN|nr:hypothetical protein KIN20_014201 [Parelaphostrongylus tenuis]